VVQHQRLAALGHRTLMAGDHRPAPTDLQEGRAQPHVDPPASKPRRNRVVVLAHAAACLVVDPVRWQQPGRIERLGRQRPKVGLLGGEVLTHGAGAMADAAGVIGGARSSQVLVELGEGGDHRDRDQVAAAEPATLTLHPTLLVGALQARLAEERVEPIVAAQDDKPLVLDAVAALEDPCDRRLEVVVADPVGHPAQVGEPLDVALEERLLRLGGERPVNRPPRARQPHREQPQLRQRPLQPHPQLGEVDLGLLTRAVHLRHRHTADPTTQLAAQPGDVLAHRRLAKLGAVLGHQPLPDPMGGMPLLCRQPLVGGHPRLDQRPPPIQHRAASLGHLPLGRHRARQRLAHRAPVHPMLLGQRPDAHALQPGVTADTLEQLHPRSHPLSPRSADSATTQRRGLVGRGWGHFWRSKRPQVGPNQRVKPRPELGV